jgi:TorA maturation chaperone TorD
MRDAGLEQAIKAAGGVASLAPAIGIAQPSVCEIDEIDHLRAAEYSLLSLLLGKAPHVDTLSRVAGLKGDASDLGMAHVELAAMAAAADDRAVSKEFFDLFIGLGRGDLLPYASYYLTGFLHERPLARVREDLDRLGIERAGSSREPEDHIAILLEVMAGLARGDFEADFTEQTRFFERHLKPWASRMFADLEMSQSANFYRAVGRVGRVFMELESEAFTLSE